MNLFLVAFDPLQLFRGFSGKPTDFPKSLSKDPTQQPSVVLNMEPRLFRSSSLDAQALLQVVARHCGGPAAVLSAQAQPEAGHEVQEHHEPQDLPWQLTSGKAEFGFPRTKSLAPQLSSDPPVVPCKSSFGHGLKKQLK